MNVPPCGGTRDGTELEPFFSPEEEALSAQLRALDEEHRERWAAADAGERKRILSETAALYLVDGIASSFEEAVGLARFELEDPDERLSAADGESITAGEFLDWGQRHEARRAADAETIATLARRRWSRPMTAPRPRLRARASRRQTRNRRARCNPTRGPDDGDGEPDPPGGPRPSRPAGEKDGRVLRSEEGVEHLTLAGRYRAHADRLYREAEGQGRAGSPADAARLAAEAHAHRRAAALLEGGVAGVAGHLAAGVRP